MAPNSVSQGFSDADPNTLTLDPAVNGNGSFMGKRHANQTQGQPSPYGATKIVQKNPAAVYLPMLGNEMYTSDTVTASVSENQGQPDFQTRTVV